MSPCPYLHRSAAATLPKLWEDSHKKLFMLSLEKSLSYRVPLAAQISLAEGFSGKPFLMPGWCSAEPRELSVLLFPNPAGAAVTAGRCVGTLKKPGLQDNVLEQNREAERCCMCGSWPSPLLEYDLSLFVFFPPELDTDGELLVLKNKTEQNKTPTPKPKKRNNWFECAVLPDCFLSESVHHTCSFGDHFDLKPLTTFGC